jgi:hypothetical protein
VPVDRRPPWPWRRISGSATLVMVAAVATLEPQMAPKAAQADDAHRLGVLDGLLLELGRVLLLRDLLHFASFRSPC